MKKVLIASVTLLLGLSIAQLLPAYAAPAEWGIAINLDTNECAGYWYGDEFSQHPLPEGWEDYYPEISGDTQVIVTPIGQCTYEYQGEEACCDQLGYEYVSDNIGQGYILDDDEDEPEEDDSDGSEDEQDDSTDAEQDDQDEEIGEDRTDDNTTDDDTDMQETLIRIFSVLLVLSVIGIIVISIKIVMSKKGNQPTAIS